MKLVRSSSGTSFYESFSDLIFGTLCIFMVIVIGLVLKMRQAQDTLANAASAVISPSKYSGGTDKTQLYSGFVTIDDVDYVYFSPVLHASNMMSTYTTPETTAQMFQDIGSEAYPMVPVSRLHEFASGLEGSIQSYTVYKIWAYQQTYYIAKENQPRAVEAAKRSGLDVYLQNYSITPQQNNALFRYMNNTSDVDPYLNALDARRTALANQFNATSTKSPALRFSMVENEGKRMIRVGTFDMSPLHFTNLLRSFKPGRGFFIEYLEDGEPALPDDWIHDNVLVPTGFNDRVLSEEGKRALERQEGKQRTGP